MSTEAREMVAAILWKAQALSVEPTSIYKRRTPSAFLDAGDKAREPFLIQADAIQAALPEIIAGMVKPLEWEGEEADCFVFAKAGFCEYQISVVDTLERSCDHIWNVDFRTPSGRDELIKCKGAGSLQDAIKVANTHHRATILKDLGLEVANA